MTFISAAKGHRNAWTTNLLFKSHARVLSCRQTFTVSQMRVSAAVAKSVNAYRSKLMIVRITVVVMLVDVAVEVSLGGGGGDATPGELI